MRDDHLLEPRDDLLARALRVAWLGLGLGLGLGLANPNPNLTLALALALTLALSLTLTLTSVRVARRLACVDERHVAVCVVLRVQLVEHARRVPRLG